MKPTPAILTVASSEGGTEAQAGIGSLERYFAAINDHDFATAHAGLSQTMQGKVSLEQMTTDADSTHDDDIVIESIGTDGEILVAVVSFTSHQDVEDSPTGTPCNLWRIRYELVASGSTWLIDRAAGVDGAKPYRAC